jgi:hypothetical protein
MSLYAQLMNATGERFLVENCHQGSAYPDGSNPYFIADGQAEWCPFNLFRTSGDITNLFDRVMANLKSVLPLLARSAEKGRGGASLARPGCW